MKLKNILSSLALASAEPLRPVFIKLPKIKSVSRTQEELVAEVRGSKWKPWGRLQTLYVELYES